MARTIGHARREWYLGKLGAAESEARAYAQGREELDGHGWRVWVKGPRLFVRSEFEEAPEGARPL